MRADAQIDKIALAIEADLLGCRDLADVFGLVALADAGEERDRLVAVPYFAGDRLVAADDVAHPRLDLFEVFGRERLGAGEIVIKAGFGRRAKGDLGLGIELLDRLGHHMRGVVPQDFEPLGLVAGDDRDRGIMVDHGREVARPAVDCDRDRRLGEARPDRGRDVGAGDRPAKSRRAPSGRVTTIGADRPKCLLSLRLSAMLPPANKRRPIVPSAGHVFCGAPHLPVLLRFAGRTGPSGHEKTPSEVRRGLSGSSLGAGSAYKTSRHSAARSGRSRGDDPAPDTHAVQYHQ